MCCPNIMDLPYNADAEWIDINDINGKKGQKCTLKRRFWQNTCLHIQLHKYTAKNKPKE